MENFPHEETAASVANAENKTLKLISMRWVLPMAPFVGSALYLRYLNLIGRPDLFLATLSNTSGIMTFVVVFLLLSIAMLFVVLLPSLLLAAMSHEIRKEVGGMAAEKLSGAIAFLGVGAIITLACLTKGWILTGVVVVPLGAVLLHLLFLKKFMGHGRWAEIFPGRESGNTSWQGAAFTYVMILWVCGVMTLLPMTMAIPFLSLNDDSLYASLLGIVVLIFVAIGSLLPAWIYCALATKEKSLSVLVAGFFSTTLALVFLIAIIAPESFDRVLERAATIIGLRVQEPYRYLLNIEQFDASLFDAKQWGSKQEKQGVSLDATMPLSFADWVVLCPVSLKNSQDLKAYSMAQCLTVERDAVLRLPVGRATE